MNLDHRSPNIVNASYKHYACHCPNPRHSAFVADCNNNRLSEDIDSASEGLTRPSEIPKQPNKHRHCEDESEFGLVDPSITFG